MKKFIFLLTILSLTNFWVFSQPAFDAKRDYVWNFSGQFNSVDTVKNIFLDFNRDTMYLRYHIGQGLTTYQTNGSICDTSGRFLFYTNGCRVVDSSHLLIPGAEKINNNGAWGNYCTSSAPLGGGYPYVNGLWIIPRSETRFLVVHVMGDGTWPAKLAGTEIEVDSAYHVNFVDKNIITSIQYVSFAQLAIVRHANGKDWWIVDPRMGYPEYFKVLVTQDSIYPAEKQVVEDISIFPMWGNSSGQACFSPDGSKYIQYGSVDQLIIHDFDRCTAELSNSIQIVVQDTTGPPNPATGVAVSPNSRFLYVFNAEHVFQYDLEASNIASTKDTVAWADSISYANQLSFYQGQLGPDGKICIFPAGGQRGFHVIEYPDLQGAACWVNQHKVLGVGVFAQPPRFPNYRLGPLDYVCDTVSTGIDPFELRQESQIQLRPNPTSDYFVADINTSDYSAKMALKIEVMDATGRLVRSVSVPPYAALRRVEVGDLANGLYFVRLVSRGRILAVEKLVVSR